MATPIALGTQLGPYKIEALLGKGGMGEVFRGVDIRLGRSVAVKASREQFSARFGREARAISALNNPHICTLYDVGPSYLVMELCEGETLAARLERGKLSIQETVRHGAQIADALSAAHTKGIVHRDLKPANVMLAKAGVKVLDFGLAKSAQDETLTASHVVIGTPAYMAPEQREAKDCDARTDIYALGLILYEMASGKRWQLDQPAALDELPGTFAHVVERCLERDPEDRWQSARDLQRELQWAVSSRTDAAPVAPVGATLSNRIVWSVAAALAIALGAALWAPWRKAPPAPEVKRYQVPLKVVNPTEPFVELAVSPDGRHLAYLDFGGSVNRLWLHSLDTVEVRAMPGWEVTRSRNNNNMPAGRGIVYPFWSPDSQYIAFVSGGKPRKAASRVDRPKLFVISRRTRCPPAPGTATG
jgi:predicted Ser/Thr protein kinase